MAFQYGGESRKADDVIRDSKTSGGLYDSYLLPDVNGFKSSEGENKIRILPGTWKEKDGKLTKDWAYGVFLHYRIGPDQSAFLCAAKMKGEKCVVCEARKEAKDEEESYALKFAWRPHAYLIDRRNEKLGPVLWGMPVKQMFNEINARSVDRHSGEVLLIDHPEKGYDVFFDREGTRDRTKYKAVDIARDPSLLSRNEDLFWSEKDKEGNIVYGGDWIDYINENPIPELLVYHDQDYIEAALYARPPEKSERRGDRDEERSDRRGGGREETRGRDRDDRGGEAESIRSRSTRSRDDDEGTSRRGRESKEEAPSRRSRLDDDNGGDKREERRSEREETTSTRRRLATEDGDAPSRRSREDDERPRERERSNGRGSEDEAPFRPRSRETSDDREPDVTQSAKAELEDLKNSRRSRD